MFDPQMELLLTVLTKVAESSEQDAAGWTEALAAIEACEEVDDDVQLIVMEQDGQELRSMLAEWMSGKRHLLVHDREVLKRALKAFRKRLKITLLDAESSLGGGPMSSGRKSSIFAITPPVRYPRSVWDELVRQGRLLGGKKGMYELPPE